MADALSTKSRSYYERSRGKVAYSIIVAAASMMLLGFCSESAGLVESYKQARKQLDDSAAADNPFFKHSYAAEGRLMAGYGFGAFAFIVSFILLVIAAITSSPLCCGTPNEKKMLSTPQELAESSSGY